MLADLRTLYSTINKSSSTDGLDGYFPQKKYEDIAQMKYQREKAEGNFKRDKPKHKLDLKCKKGTFLQAIYKREAKTPSPQNYKPTQYEASYKSRKLSNLPDRANIFTDLVKENKKNPTPSPQDYVILLQKQKSMSLGKFQKCQNTNYLDSAISNASILPGVGQYNLPRKSSFSKQLGKWGKQKRQHHKENREPSATTYFPKVIDKKLFCNMSTKKSQNKLNKAKRFETQTYQKLTQKCNYLSISEWGIRANKKNKDSMKILSNHHKYSKSVYYE